jgi:hypothetical protein
MEGVGVFVGVIDGVGVTQFNVTTTPFNISVLV